MKPWHQRTLTRAIFTALLVLLATLRSSIGGGLDSNEVIDLIQNPLIAFMAWFGIGALPGPGNLIEPFLNRSPDAEVAVPSPPADPEKP